LAPMTGKSRKLHLHFSKWLSKASLLPFLRGALPVALRTIMPSLLFLFAPLYFFRRGPFAIVVWVICLLLWLAFWGVAESVRSAARQAATEAVEDRSMMLRQVLASLRKLTNDRTTALMDMKRVGPRTAMANAFDHDRLMGEIVGAVFSVVSRGNQDLEKHFRVTFMEAHEDGLRIRYYANTDNEVPGTMAAGECFAKGEGVAGQAWSRLDTVIVPDVEVDIGRGGIFVPKTREHEQFSIKSLVSIPVVLRDPVTQTESLIGVLNVDSDEPQHFTDDHDQRRLLEIAIRPYVRLIRLLYAARVAVNTLQAHGVAI
jgi:hypothetical protein